MKVNALLIRHRDGFAVYTDAASVTAHGRKEAFLVHSEASEAEAEHLALGTFAFAAADQWAVRLGVEPTGTGDVPYTDWEPGDTLTAPDPEGAPASVRVQALTVTEDPEGNVIYSPEVGDVLVDPDGRVRQWLDRAGLGLLGGRSKVADGGGGGGGSRGGGQGSIVVDGGGCLVIVHYILIGCGDATYEFIDTDLCQVVDIDHYADVTVTIPTNGSVGFPIGAVILLRQVGSGQVIVTGAGGVTVNAPDAADRTRVTWSEMRLHQRMVDEWVLSGDIM